MRHLNKILAVPATMVVGLTLYLGAYLVMLDGVGSNMVVAQPRGFFDMRRPIYRYDRPFVRTIFTPANNVDRRLRQETWRPRYIAPTPGGPF